MRSGTLRHEATIERLTSASTDLDDRGQPTQSWGREAVVRASLTPLRGQEAIEVHQLFATATHILRCRYTPRIKPSMRVSARGRTFAINEVRNVLEKDRELEIVLTEEVHG